jgi:hypothetical protein
MANEGLKAVLGEVFDSISSVEDIREHDYFGLVEDIAKLIANSADVFSHILDLKAEIKELPGSMPQHDLISFIETEFSSQFPSTRAQAILNTSLNIVKSSIMLVEDSMTMKNLFTQS